MEQLLLDLDLCKNRVEQAKKLAAHAAEQNDNESVEYWTNSMNGWIAMIAELDAELKESDRG